MSVLPFYRKFGSNWLNISSFFKPFSEVSSMKLLYKSKEYQFCDMKVVAIASDNQIEICAHSDSILFLYPLPVPMRSIALLPRSLVKFISRKMQIYKLACIISTFYSWNESNWNVYLLFLDNNKAKKDHQYLYESLGLPYHLSSGDRHDSWHESILLQGV